MGQRHHLQVELALERFAVGHKAVDSVYIDRFDHCNDHRVDRADRAVLLDDSSPPIIKLDCSWSTTVTQAGLPLREPFP